MGDRACNPIPDGVTDNCVNRERGLSGPPLEMFLPNLKIGVYPEISWLEYSINRLVRYRIRHEIS